MEFRRCAAIAAVVLGLVVGGGGVWAAPPAGLPTSVQVTVTEPSAGFYGGSTVVGVHTLTWSDSIPEIGGLPAYVWGDVAGGEYVTLGAYGGPSTYSGTVEVGSGGNIWDQDVSLTASPFAVVDNGGDLPGGALSFQQGGAVPEPATAGLVSLPLLTLLLRRKRPSIRISALSFRKC
jgi:hypothetical protein